MIGKIYLKEIKDMFRDRKTLLLSVIVPIVMISGMLLFYESMFYASEDKVEVANVAVEVGLNEEIKRVLQENAGLELLESDDPLLAAREGVARVALIQDRADQPTFEEGKSLGLKLFADQSSMSSARAVDLVMEQISKLEQEIVNERLISYGIDPANIKPFELNIESLSGGEEVSLMLLSMLFSIVIVMSVMLGGFPAATDLFAGEKEKKTMEALLITPVSRFKLIMAKWLTIATLGVISGLFSILAFLIITLTVTKNMAQAINIWEQPVMLFLSAFVGITAFAFMFATIQMMISIIAKTFKEAQNYLSPVMFLAMIPYFLMIGVIPNEFTLKHYLIPFMNIFALLKELIYGIYSVQTMLYVAGSSLVVIIIAFLIANWMFTKDKWVLGK